MLASSKGEDVVVAGQRPSVWSKYNTRAKKHDEKLLGNWEASMDVLLVFVSTTAVSFNLDLRQNRLHCSLQLLHHLSLNRSTISEVKIQKLNFSVSSLLSNTRINLRQFLCHRNHLTHCSLMPYGSLAFFAHCLPVLVLCCAKNGAHNI